MKQRITEKQFNELSDEGKEKYSDFCSGVLKITVGKNVTYKKSGSDLLAEDVEWHVPMLTIGQMVELLDTAYLAIIRRVDGWEFGAVDQIDKKGKELCDVLWEAVKERLET